MQRRAKPMPIVPPEPAASLRRAVIAATDSVVRPTDTMEPTGRAGALANGLAEQVIAALPSAAPPPLQARVPRNAIRLVGAGVDFLRANITRSIYTDEICKALAVSPRKLHHAFVAVCGISPQAYLKRRRLLIVHQALRAGGPDAPLVKSVALAHGFWHLGNFARDYRAQFGQSPSDTLALGRSGRYRQ